MSSAFHHLGVQLDLTTSVSLYVDFLTVIFLSDNFNEGNNGKFQG